jgi:hypothetical protein
MAKTCNSCNTNDMAVMPIAQHEKDQNRLTKIIKWLVIANIIMLLVAVVTNAFWIWRDSQYEEVVTSEETIIEAKQDGTGINIVGGGDVEYGTDS